MTTEEDRDRFFGWYQTAERRLAEANLRVIQLEHEVQALRDRNNGLELQNTRLTATLVGAYERVVAGAPAEIPVDHGGEHWEEAMNIFNEWQGPQEQ